MQRLTGAFVSALILFAPTMARAQDQEAVADLRGVNTSTDRGAERALHRIRRAAEDVCDAAPGIRSFEERAAGRACIQDAMSRAVADLGDPMVASKFNGESRYAQVGERT